MALNMALIKCLSTRIVDQFKDRKVFVANYKAVAFAAGRLSNVYGQSFDLSRLEVCHRSGNLSWLKVRCTYGVMATEGIGT
jgi:hypothetical protein